MNRRSTDFNQQHLAEVSFVLLDFETVTPTGKPPEPIELAAMRITPGFCIDQQFRANWLIKPPKDAPFTTFDTRQTGIRWEDLCDKPAATTILQEFEALLHHDLAILPAILVAHNASYDANILWRFANACPALAALPFVDTLALAKRIVPNLYSYRLDALAQYYSLPIPHNRHRALPDVQLTIQIFLRLISLYLEKKPAATVADLRHLAGITRKKQPVAQLSLFDETGEE
jgi:DNA polymerase-3 subunit epsilon